jgi:hypothetical protein
VLLAHHPGANWVHAPSDEEVPKVTFDVHSVAGQHDVCRDVAAIVTRSVNAPDSPLLKKRMATLVR